MPIFQNSPRGGFAKGRLVIHNSQGEEVALTASEHGLRISGAIILSGRDDRIGVNTTAYIFSHRAALPNSRSDAKITFITNSTGVNAIGINTTGTTWKYVNVTSIIPT